MPYTWRGPYPLRRVSCITRVSVSKLPKGPGPGRLPSVSLLVSNDPRMKRLFLVVVAVAMLAVSACGGRHGASTARDGTLPAGGDRTSDHRGRGRVHHCWGAVAAARRS